jgi:hypothetical protein
MPKEFLLMILTYLFVDRFEESGMVIVTISVVAFVAIAGLIRSRRKRQELGPPRNIVPYRERFEQMKAEAEAKYGPSVEFLRPEMEMGDDPEAFERAWKQFEQGDRNRLTISRDLSAKRKLGKYRTIDPSRDEREHRIPNSSPPRH